MADGQPGGDQPFIGGGDGIAIHRKLAGELADRRQNLSGLQATALHQMADMIEDIAGGFSGKHY